MNSLLNYGSDDDYDDSSEEKKTDFRETSSKKPAASTSKQPDTNYEEVQMDLSEGSNDSRNEGLSSSSSRRSRDRRGDDYYRTRHDRRSSRRRSRSRERRRSRSPRSRYSRSRSRSRDRSRKYSKRYERNKNDYERERPKPAVESKQPPNSDGNRFFMPGITGRFRDQIERRKQLWQKKETVVEDKTGQGKKVWESTTFAQDTDGKVANKFKRLMGIKNAAGGNSSSDGLKKQEEMFSSMEQQYEVARTTTHTMRGVGLGFGNFNR